MSSCNQNCLKSPLHPENSFAKSFSKILTQSEIQISDLTNLKSSNKSIRRFVETGLLICARIPSGVGERNCVMVEVLKRIELDKVLTMK